MHLAISLIKQGLSHDNRALLIGNSSPQFLIFLMALHRVGARAVLLGPGDLTPDKINLIVTKNINCRLIAYDTDINDSQAKQLITGIKHLVKHNSECERKPQILVALNDKVDAIRRAEHDSYTKQEQKVSPTDQGLRDNELSGERRELSGNSGRNDELSGKRRDDDYSDERHNDNLSDGSTTYNHETTSDLWNLREQYANSEKANCFLYNELLNYGQSEDLDMLHKAESN